MSGAMDANKWVAKQKSPESARRKLKQAMKKAKTADRQLVVPKNEPWPRLDWPGPAYIGLAKEVVDKLSYGSEADPAALLMTFLTEFGNALGDDIYTRADQDVHPGRLDVLLVGRTSRARKGVAQNKTSHLMGWADPHWAQHHQVRALSTPEGLAKLLMDRGKRCLQNGQCHGGRRMLVTIPEFSHLLRVAERKGNPLSEGLRQLWDFGLIHVPTRKDPIFVDAAQVSVIGHITAEELLVRMSDTDMMNGFANRFLFCCVERTRKIPSPKAQDDEALGELVSDALTRARKLGYLKRSVKAEGRWAKIYNSLPDRRGAIGMLAARAEAQMLRLQVIYAAMAGHKRIMEQDVAAAFAIWEYCEAGARYIFGDTTGDAVADKILAALRLVHPDWMGTVDIRDDLFARHVAAPVLEGALKALESMGMAEKRMVKTKGRPRWEYRAIR
jgi:hypothetical protein